MKQNNNETQIICCSCNSRKIQLLIVRALNNNTTELDLLCKHCGVVQTFTIGGVIESKPEPKHKKELSYLG